MNFNDSDDTILLRLTLIGSSSLIFRLRIVSTSESTVTATQTVFVMTRSRDGIVPLDDFQPRCIAYIIHRYIQLQRDTRRTIVASDIGWTLLPGTINAGGINRVGDHAIVPPCIHSSLRIIMISVTVVQQGVECDHARWLMRERERHSQRSPSRPAQGKRD